MNNGMIGCCQYLDSSIELEVEGSQEKEGEEGHPHKIGNQDVIPGGGKHTRYVTRVITEPSRARLLSYISLSANQAI